MSGWIKLHRSLLDWEWYDDLNATRLLIHLLVSVNYEDKKWKGQDVKAGSIILSWETLSKAVGLSVKQCRVAMQKLENSGEVARQRADQWQVVSLCKWEKMQGCEDNRADDRAFRGQSEGRQRATTKEYKEYKEVKELKKDAFELFETWMKYKAEIKDSYKSETSIIQLAKKFNSEPLPKLAFVVNNSIQNGWKGLFWDKYTPEQSSNLPLPKEIKPNVSF
jgi:hypothetical protein